MIRPLETDGAPAPSDTELVALDATNAKRRYGFNGAVKLLNINEDREEFHRWCGRFVNMSITHTEDKWRTYYMTFGVWDSYQHSTPNDDATDLYDTQQDSIAPPW